MPNVPDHDHIRELLNRLDEIQRESESLRSRIDSIRRRRPEYPHHGDSGFDALRASDEHLFHVIPHDDGSEPGESSNND